ncbi:MAG: NAD(P)H-hydrate dehydratase [Oscillospiraceae bacterium]|nr:NAD(P)H-hydrate dehydratase [Oscillospiraceae bacterium]
MMETQMMTPEQIKLPHRDREAHKGMFGKVAVVGGSVGLSGAPVMAATAAVRTGSGLVYALVPEHIWPIVAAKLTCAVAFPLPGDRSSMVDGESLTQIAAGICEGVFAKSALEPAIKRLEGMDAVLIGPGMSRNKGTTTLIRKLAGKLECPLVLDADGINAFSGHIDELDERPGLTVLTPHPREFIRLGVELGEDRVEAARDFAVTHHCVLVLKGHRTVTAFPDGECFVNATGNPGMAKGGSGDVLAGMILSLIGQGLPPKQAVPWAVCLHGLAGDMAAEEFGEYGMTPMNLLDKIPLTMKRF